ncbi:hypothetical protein VTN96DRAFT_1736 [Rasamsonia emersonii]
MTDGDTGELNRGYGVERPEQRGDLWHCVAWDEGRDVSIQGLVPRRPWQMPDRASINGDDIHGVSSPTRPCLRLVETTLQLLVQGRRRLDAVRYWDQMRHSCKHEGRGAWAGWIRSSLPDADEEHPGHGVPGNCRTSATGHVTDG